MKPHPMVIIPKWLSTWVKEVEQLNLRRQMLGVTDNEWADLSLHRLGQPPATPTTNSACTPETNCSKI